MGTQRSWRLKFFSAASMNWQQLLNKLNENYSYGHVKLCVRY